MNIVKMFYDNLDIMPRVLITDFLAYLGYYVDEISSNSLGCAEKSDFDIYIISKNNVDKVRSKSEIVENTIFIMLDGYNIENACYKILYHPLDDKSFLEELMKNIWSLLTDYNLNIPFMKNNDYNLYQELVNNLIKSYTDNHILFLNLYSNYLSGFEPMLLKNYGNFVSDLYSISEESDLALYMHLKACTSHDIVRKHYHYKNKYDFKNMEELITRYLMYLYPNNVQLGLLYCKVCYYIEEFPIPAYNEYFFNFKVRNCAKFFYNAATYMMKIEKQEPEKKVLECYQNALYLKPDYFEVKYAIAQIKYSHYFHRHDSIPEYESVVLILEDRFKKHLLSNHEFLYLYNAWRKLSELDGKRYDSNELFILEQSIEYDHYFKTICNNDSKMYNQYSKPLQKKLKAQLDIR